MTTDAKHLHALDLSEIRIRIGQFLRSNDAVCCSQVCRSWGADFTRVTWSKVDLKRKHPEFTKLDHAVVVKNGHHIRTLTTSQNLEELWPLSDPDIQHLKNVHIHLPPTKGLLPHAAHILRRSGASLTKLEISGGGRGYQYSRTIISFVDGPIPWAAPFNTVLSTLTLNCKSMTRTFFSMLLSGCTHLHDIRLHGCSFTGDTGANPFKHQRIKCLTISIDRVMSPDSPEETAPLFVHLPKLRGWNALSLRSTIDDSMPSALKAQVQEHCPELATLYVPRIKSVLAHSLLTKVFERLHKLVLEYKSIAPDLIHGLLYHKATLSSIITYVSSTNDRVFLSDQVSPVSDSFRQGWMIQLLPSNCHELEKLRFPFHQMEIESIETFTWRCPKLKDLRIRVRGLDSKESILEVIDMWRRARRNPEQEIVETGDPSRLENRVVRHLLTFSELSTLWLGYKAWPA